MCVCVGVCVWTTMVMEWVHLVLSVAIYAKLAALIYLVIRHLSFMQQGKGVNNSKRQQHHQVKQE